MNRKQSNSSGKQRQHMNLKLNDARSPILNENASAKKRKKSNYDLQLNLSNKADSDFGEEIEDQYYKRSIPPGGGLLLLSPKRSSEPPTTNGNNSVLLLSPTNRDHHQLVNKNNCLMQRADEEAEECEEGDEVGVDIDQFAHLSVDEDESEDDVGADLQGQ